MLIINIEKNKLYIIDEPNKGNWRIRADLAFDQFGSIQCGGEWITLQLSNDQLVKFNETECGMVLVKKFVKMVNIYLETTSNDYCTHSRPDVISTPY